MKIIGITRVRNEQPIIRETLDHVAKLVDGIVVYDDCSTDLTSAICAGHWAVKRVIRGERWESQPWERAQAEGKLRQIPYEAAVELGADWVYYFDGDEFLEPAFPGSLSNLIEEYPSAKAFRFRLFDFYITQEDIGLPWHQRRFIGPEYRDILMLFRVHPAIIFLNREPSCVLPPIQVGGDVRHYGKAISVSHWEETCDYYINHRGGDLLPQFSVKWRNRRGRAVHTESDFGNPLIRWEERAEKGFPLHDPPEQYAKEVALERIRRL